MKNIQEEIDKIIKSTGKMGKYLLSLFDEKTFDETVKEIEKFLTENSHEEWKNLVTTQLDIHNSNIKLGISKETADALFFSSIHNWFTLCGDKIKCKMKDDR